MLLSAFVLDGRAARGLTVVILRTNTTHRNRLFKGPRSLSILFVMSKLWNRTSSWRFCSFVPHARLSSVCTQSRCEETGLSALFKPVCGTTRFSFRFIIDHCRRHRALLFEVAVGVLKRSNVQSRSGDSSCPRTGERRSGTICSVCACSQFCILGIENDRGSQRPR